MGIISFIRANKAPLITVVLALVVGGFVGAWYLGFSVDLTRFFAAEVGVMTVQCSPSGNTITWTVDSRANSNSIQRGNSGPKNLPNCADYWCWLPSVSFPHQTPTTGNPAAYTDNQLQPGECYAYRIKYRPELPSNVEYCPVNCNIAGTPTPSATRVPTPTPCPPGTVQVGETNAIPPQPICVTPTPTPTVCAPPTPPQCSDGRDPVAQYGTDECIVGWTCPTPSPTPSCVPVPQCVYDEPACAVDLAPGAVLCPTPSPTPTATPTPTPTSSPTGTPEPDAVSCSPASQDVGIDETVTFTASGGTGTYSWSAPSGDVRPSSSGDVLRVSYGESGGYSVIVNDGTDSDVCTVSVSDEPQPTVVVTVTPEPGDPFLRVDKTVRNITRGSGEQDAIGAFPGETIEFIIRVTSVGDEVARNVTVTDDLPSGLTFVGGSATLDGQFESAPPINISLGDMVPGRTSIIRFRMTANQGVGADATNTARVFVSNTSRQFSDTAVVLLVAVAPSGTPIPIAQVPTGPGQASVVALIVSAIVTLMYIGYTSTDMFRRREAGGIARSDKRHPDFHG